MSAVYLELTVRLSIGNTWTDDLINPRDNVQLGWSTPSTPSAFIIHNDLFSEIFSPVSSCSKPSHAFY